MEIKNVEDLTKSLLLAGEKFLSCECQSLLPPGENYGSVMLLVKLKFSGADGAERIVDCVAKTCPPPGFLWEIFNTKVTFKKEIALYNTIVPLLNDFGREKSVDCLIDFVANCKSARISSNPQSDEVDEDAILLLENLKVQGFEVGDRFVGFDLETTKLLLEDLAKLHASVIAFKSAKPKEYKEKILPYLTKHPHPDIGDDIENDNDRKMKEGFCSIPECVPHWPRIESALKYAKEVMKTTPKSNDIFKTLTHNDFWVNNTMVKYENGKPVKNSMVDFQIIEESSLANDVVFFIYSSVELSVLEHHIDELYRFYYDSLMKILKRLDFDVSVYSFDAMMDECALIAKHTQFLHVIFMLLPIMTLKGKAKELTDLSMNDILVDKTSLHENYYKRMKFVALDLIERGWL